MPIHKSFRRSRSTLGSTSKVTRSRLLCFEGVSLISIFLEREVDVERTGVVGKANALVRSVRTIAVWNCILDLANRI